MKYIVKNEISISIEDKERLVQLRERGILDENNNIQISINSKKYKINIKFNKKTRFINICVL